MILWLHQISRDCATVWAMAMIISSDQARSPTMLMAAPEMMFSDRRAGTIPCLAVPGMTRLSYRQTICRQTALMEERSTIRSSLPRQTLVGVFFSRISMPESMRDPGSSTLKQ